MIVSNISIELFFQCLLMQRVLLLVTYKFLLPKARLRKDNFPIRDPNRSPLQSIAKILIFQSIMDRVNSLYHLKGQCRLMNLPGHLIQNRLLILLPQVHCVGPTLHRGELVLLRDLLFHHPLKT